ncbi:MAG: trigger factor [Bacteroidales bacterium]|nr:trigger factor [Bacteroidales bacterium]MBO7479235.1 trigger factor [Bacteroidales bacterium]
MQINQTKNQDDLTLKVSIKVDKEDYAEDMNRRLKEYRHKADIRGFRKGMAPMGLIEKLYGGQALSDAVNTVVSQELGKFIEDNKLNVIGEPLPSEDQEPAAEDAESFTFNFDLGVTPDIDVDVTSEDTIPYYTVTVAAKAVADYKDSLLRQYGNMESGEKAGEDDFIVVDFKQGETEVKDAYVSLRSISEEAKSIFLGIKKDDVKELDVNEVFPNDSDRAAMLHMSKDDLKDMDPKWQMTVKDVKTFVAAKPTPETFERIFGKDVVKDEAAFDAKVKDLLKNEYARESEFRFAGDARDYLLKKADIKLPEAFLKRWLIRVNEGKFTPEEIEKEFGAFTKDFRWQMICNHLMKAHDMQVTKEDLDKEARALAAYQFAMYGMNDVPEDQLAGFADRLLGDDDQARRLYDKVEADKVVAYIKDTVTLEKKKSTIEKMRQQTK